MLPLGLPLALADFFQYVRWTSNHRITDLFTGT